MSKAFVRACEAARLKKPVRDDENVPTIRPRSKKKPWMLVPWGRKTAALIVMGSSGKMVGSVVRRFKEHIPQKDVTYQLGDWEAVIVFPLEVIPQVGEHFNLLKRRITDKQAAVLLSGRKKLA